MSNPLALKVPPHSPEAEQAAIGACLFDPGGAALACEMVLPEHFHNPANQEIFAAIKQLFETAEPIDIITVKSLLESQGKLDQVGGAVYLSSILDAVPSSANLESYLKIIRDKALLRRLIGSCSEIITDCFAPHDETTDVLSAAEQKIFEISSLKLGRDFQHVRDVAREVFDNIEKAMESRSSLTGVPSGFRDLDRITSGLQPSDLIILAARPAMGKTSLALNILTNISINFEFPVAMFSLEMSCQQLVHRMICSLARVDAARARGGMLPYTDMSKLLTAMGALNSAPLYIDDSSGVTVTEMRSKLRRLSSTVPLKLVVVDYLQLLTGGSSRRDNRQQEISEISRQLKGMARELNCPVLALSQLSRQVEQRPDKRPILSDLRESGAIEQDADIVTFLYRDDYYDADSTAAQGVTELKIAKHRNGPIGTIKLLFSKPETRFYDYSERDYDFSAADI